ncbi:aerotolerance regulator BatA [Vibrio sp. UCD-FRSSP16_10]|uniref:vWA domain-containing protein n=1 Tax=unclassified Vibrio TaxID=2614977 RepID=UPI000800997A|nr:MULTISPECIES: VWA domain-containing protein [unclassified Vibrio]OBT07948.1 aerotolerance regulator BatA [Vibrio sp. UCD-FRSSP16_30]OBT17123.1 aerotolerance regulator BatA [Vibrio sp. UCD-FRSSP16_10]
MIEFEYPLAVLLLLLPFLVYRFVPAYKESKSAIQVPFFDRLVSVSENKPSQHATQLKRRKIQWLLVVLSYLSLVAAIAKPMWVGEPIEQKKSAREIMVALDLSGSMSEKDFTDEQGIKHDRLFVAKQVLSEFGQRRQHDRLGLILFADAAYVQAPFTEDTHTWLALLDDVQLGYAGFQTAFGDAIGLSIAVFEQEKSRQRVMILLTDGDDTSSKMPPIKAAEIAAKHGVKIYTIAIGDPSTEGRYKMDLPTLEKISQITGGQMFHAMDRAQLDQAYTTIDTLEQQQFEVLTHRPRHSLHQWAFGVCFILNLIAAILVILGQQQRARRARNVIERAQEVPNE